MPAQEQMAPIVRIVRPFKISTHRKNCLRVTTRRDISIPRVMSLQTNIARLALAQIAAVFYATLVIGLIVRIRFGSPAPPMFATYLRDYGLFLLVVPLTWSIWASISVDHPKAGTGNLVSALVSGLVVLGVLVTLGFVGTVSACIDHLPMVSVEPTPPLVRSHPPIAKQLPPE